MKNRRLAPAVRVRTALTTLGLLGPLILASAQTIPNPSFEANSFTVYPGYISSNANIVGWTASDNTRAGLNPVSGSADHNPFANNGTVPNGANVAFIENSTNSSLSTVISNLTVGETYKVNFRVNARDSSGNTPNLKVDIGGTNIIYATVTPVGSTNAYLYFAFDFTATATNQTMTLRNDATAEATVLLDNFSIAFRNSGWSYAAWTNDASSGVSSNRTYTHAFAFGTNVSLVINGVTFTGIPGANPSSNGVFSTTGLPNVYNNDTNNLTSGGGGSSELASNFLWGGAVESLTIQGLTIGEAYVATIYSVGFDTSGTRAATFSVGNDRLTVNQDQFGYHNGIRVSCQFTANATSNTLTYVPLNPATTFHTYGFSVYQVHGLKLVVTNAADSGPGSLRQLVSQADAFTRITFTNTLSGQTILLTSGQITISTNVTIDASGLPAGVTVSGNHASRIFEVSAGATLSLNALTLTNGYASGGDGGAILVDTGGTLTLNNSTLSGNSANIGGGIFENPGTLTVNDSTLSGNSSSLYGGGIESYGTLTVNNSTFSSNSATGGGGGGIECESSGTLALNNTIVAGNSAGAAPTNIYVTSGSFTGVNNLTNGNPLLAPLGNYGGPTQTMPPLAGSPAIDAGDDSVTNFLATDQRGFPRKIGAHVDIGAVEYMASPVVTTTADAGGGSLRDAILFSTNGVTITFTNTLSGQTIVLTGGQIALNQSVTIDASSLPAGITLSGNAASRIFGVSAGTIVTLDSLTLTNGYEGSDYGGAIIVGCPGGTLTLNNSTLSGNSAGADGGGIYGGCQSTITLNNSTLSGNFAGQYGGGIFNNGPLVLNNSTLSGNSATNGGGIGISSGAILTVNNSTLSGNTAGQGGGVYLEPGAPATFQTNTIVVGNSATQVGGGIAMASGSTLTINDSTLSSNSASSYGGGIYNNTGTLAINDSTVSRNSATNYDGGGIWNEGTLQLNGCTISSNSAPNGYGGGILNNVFMLTITNCTLSGNSAVLGGGGIDNVNGGTSTVNNSTLSSNTVASSGGGVGGGIYNDRGSTFTVNSCILSGNSAKGNPKADTGGGILNDGTLTLNNSTLSGNSSGGAGGAIGNLAGILAVNNSTLSDNSANTDDGGGIYDYGYLYGATNTLNNCTLTGNSAYGYGGGIANDLNTVLTISNSTLSGNTAGFGGGIANDSTLTVNNSTLANNSATTNMFGGGGGIWNQGANTLNNCTLSGNSAPNGYGGGMNNDAGDLFFTNTIVAGNNALTYPDFYNNNSASFSGSDNLTNGMPLLAPLGNYGGPTQTMPPLAGSPAIDAGTDSVTNFLPTDQRGFPRLSGAHVDIGAVEVQTVSAANAPRLTSPVRQTNGTFGFSFTNLVMADFTVLGSTNLALPLNQWSPLGAAIQYQPGQFQFTDSSATNYPQRFYRVISP